MLEQLVPEEAVEAAEQFVATSPRKAVYEMAYDIAEGCVRAAAPAIRKQERERLIIAAQRVREFAEKWTSEHRQRAHDLIHKAAPKSRTENLVAANAELLLAQGVEKFFAALDTLEDSGD